MKDVIRQTKLDSQKFFIALLLTVINLENMTKGIIFDKSKHKVAIIAPAGPPKEDPFNMLQQAVLLLERNGFQVKYNENILSNSDLSYFAAQRETRLYSLHQALLDPEILIIWGLRGGYGAGEIIFDCLNLTITNPKILIGFSDLTAMHFLFTQHHKLPGIHGSVLSSLIDKQSSMIDELLAVLSGTEMKIKLTDILLSSISSQQINGPIMGGNLTLICNMIGTKLSPDFKNKIIFVEDVNDKGYQVHRNLLHMKNAGLFDQVRAVIFGDFSASDDLLDQSIISFCKHHLFDIPTFRAKGIGHENINHPIVLGAKAQIINHTLIVPSPFKLI